MSWFRFGCTWTEEPVQHPSGGVQRLLAVQVRQDPKPEKTEKKWPEICQ